MEHPYTKLLEELDGAHYVRFQKDRNLVYFWKGDSRVEVCNMEGACVDFFGVEPNANVEDVARQVEAHMAEPL